MERSKKGNLQLSKTTLTSLSGGGYMYSWGKGNAKYGKAGLGKGKLAGKGKYTGDFCTVIDPPYLKGKDHAKLIPTFGDICATTVI